MDYKRDLKLKKTKELFAGFKIKINWCGHHTTFTFSLF